MIKKDQIVKYLPIIAYLGFFLMYVIRGILLVSGLLSPDTFGLVDLPMYQPLTYADLLILLAMNIPTFTIILIATMRLKSTSVEMEPE